MNTFIQAVFDAARQHLIMQAYEAAGHNIYRAAKALGLTATQFLIELQCVLVNSNDN